VDGLKILLIGFARFCVRDRSGNPFCPLPSGKKIATESPTRAAGCGQVGERPINYRKKENLNK